MKFTKTYEPGRFEPMIYELWEKSKAFRPSGKGEPYAIVMPPPNANGNLHIGHGLVIALEDVLTRYHRLRGRDTIYIPGADHAGFETWVVYEKELERAGGSRFDFSREQLYSQVWDFVAEQRGNMELQLRAMGASCSWDDLVFTLDKKVIQTVYRTFKRLWDDGMIYRGEKLVNYCTKHQTAFADIEVNYEDRKTPLYYLKYGPFVLATTRPETKFGDTAVAVHPDDKRYKKYIGKVIDVEGVNGPFAITVVADEMVDMEFGTGVVKVTPAHDFNDWEVAQRHRLDAKKVIGMDGKMLANTGRFEGMTVEEARKAVVEALIEKDLLVKVEEDYQNRVGVCYKCDTVIEPMLMEQWFINVKPMVLKAVEVLKADEIRFVPAGKKDVLIRYFENLKDWNISRQIPWGIPIPMFRRMGKEGAEDGDDVLTREEIDAIDNGLDVADPPVWLYDERVEETEIVVNGIRYVRDEDTFDTWFSSAQWPFVVTNYFHSDPESGTECESDPNSLCRRSSSLSSQVSSANSSPSCGVTTQEIGSRSTALKRFYPNSVMETGSDLLFPWVSRMIMLGVYETGQVPFKEVYMHGLVLDEKGQKMSKSKGNVINPMEVIAEYGSDAFRLGIVAARSAGQNQAFAKSKVVAGRNLCNKLWNVARYIQTTVGEDFEWDGAVELAGQGDDWVVREILRARDELEELMGNYRFAEASELVYQVIWGSVADWYVEVSKLTGNPGLMAWVLESCLRLIHPFAPFVSETIWQTLSWTKGELIGAGWIEDLKFDDVKAGKFEEVMKVVGEIRFVTSELPGNGRYAVGYREDELVAENAELVRFLARVPEVREVEEGVGMKLAVAGRNVWLEVDAEVLVQHRVNLEERLWQAEKEKEKLRARLLNENYMKKAPKELVVETKQAMEEQRELVERLKRELKVES
ncbi:class I tRNA ligase family protein [Candidatus Saccharibacteria bacterium]|nr:class I tRNA ligase family protein [Candidatus Saccharibacteria bacterium]